jgi:hypothetical protein
MLHAGVEPELADDVVALPLRAGHADRAAPFDASDLADDRANGPRRGRHDNGLARLRLTDIKQTDIRGEARHAKDTERARNWRRSRIQLPEVLAARTSVLLPAVVTRHDIARPERGVSRFDDLANGLADHHLSEGHGHGVGGCVSHPTAHVGIERQIDRAAQDVALLRRWNRRDRDLEVFGHRHADGPATEQHLAVCHGTIVGASPARSPSE